MANHVTFQTKHIIGDIRVEVQPTTGVVAEQKTHIEFQIGELSCVVGAAASHKRIIINGRRVQTMRGVKVFRLDEPPYIVQIRGAAETVAPILAALEAATEAQE